MRELNGHADVAGFALGLLSDEELRQLDEHVASCRDCRRDLDELVPAGALLRLAAPAGSPPPGLEGRVFLAVERAAAEAVRPRAPRRRRLPTLVLTGAGALATAAALAVLVLAGPSPLLELEAVLRAPTGAAEAHVEVEKTGVGRVITFRSDSLPILPKGDYYELWFVGPKESPRRPDRISAGTFHPDEQGRSHVRFTAAVDPAAYPVLSVTAEPGDGNPRATGPEVLSSRP